MKLSIISITMDDAEGILRTYTSIAGLLLQNPRDVEWIIIDSSKVPISTTHEQIVQAKNCTVKWCEPNGVYAAMNEGTSLARGDWLLFLNGGDTLIDHEILNLISTTSEHDSFLTGHTMVVDKCGLIKIRKARPTIPWILHGVTAIQQSWIVRAKIARSHPFDTSFKITGDYAFEASLHKDGIPTKRINRIIAAFYKGGLSTRYRSLLQREAERVQKNTLSMSSLSIAISRLLRR